ncbi:hypothetical protein DPMN_145660 [Dreissena polymorpha]|uniref:Uncharacterized protein n=1 Tax=Dreissena polymorpha TaxID=45954 RepID=A0A9D4J1A2_DREPO|nr:hypothetical protein DPMN_145660 [Dreissena polymorpha]
MFCTLGRSVRLNAPLAGGALAANQLVIGIALSALKSSSQKNVLMADHVVMIRLS